LLFLCRAAIWLRHSHVAAQCLMVTLATTPPPPLPHPPTPSPLLLSRCAQVAVTSLSAARALALAGLALPVLLTVAALAAPLPPGPSTAAWSPSGTGDGDDPTCTPACPSDDYTCCGTGASATCCEGKCYNSDEDVACCPSTLPPPLGLPPNITLFAVDAPHCNLLIVTNTTDPCFLNYWAAHGYQYNGFCIGKCPSIYVLTQQQGVLRGVLLPDSWEGRVLDAGAAHCA
jgi:hypothetical protein